MYRREKWVFGPQHVVTRPLTELADVLRAYGISQRHTVDAAAWRMISESVHGSEKPDAVGQAIFAGQGDAVALLEALRLATPRGTPRFPFLSGPKVGPMWVRMLVEPGRARISSIETIPVAVDVQVRKVTEHLGVTRSAGEQLEQVRAQIQNAWAEDVRLHGAEGPSALTNTCATLDPALWYYGKWGCTFCERAKRRLPICDLCSGCEFGA